jgi:hypothetical protein
MQTLVDILFIPVSIIEAFSDKLPQIAYTCIPGFLLVGYAAGILL